MKVSVLNKMIVIKKHKSFYVPGERVPNFSKKNDLPKFKSKLICVVGPNGSGKTTNMNAMYNILQMLPITKIPMYFSTGKHIALYRFFSRLLKIMRVYSNLLEQKTTITDRYIFLSFRKSNPFFKKIARFIAPSPDLVFVTKARYKVLKERRGNKAMGQKEVEDYYKLFKDLKNTHVINTEKPIVDNMATIINKILALFGNEEDEKKYINKFI